MMPDPLLERISSQQVADRQRAMTLRSCASDLANRLRGRGATRVVLFGSLATGAQPHAGTDIDLCVFGLDDPAFGEAVIEFMEVAPAPVDLVRGEAASPRVLRAVARDGKDI